MATSTQTPTAPIRTVSTEEGTFKTRAGSRLESQAITPSPTTPTTSLDQPKGSSSSNAGYYPRYTTTQYTAPEVQTTEQLTKDRMSDAQGEINSLLDLRNERLREQSVINDKNDRNTSSVSTLTGLAGSTEANVQQQATTRQGQQANDLIRAEYEAKAQGIYREIRKSAAEEARQMRIDARDDESAYLANNEKRQALAGSHIKNISSSGITLTGLRDTDPETYKYLVDSFGGEDALKGAYVLNTPQDQILDKQVKGGKYVIAKQNPMTGKVSIETIDLGLPPEYTNTIDAGDRILAIPEGWDGDTSKLISINKGLTPTQAKSGAVPGAAAAQANATNTNVLNTIDEAVAQISDISSGWAGGVSKSVPGSPAYNLQKTIDTIKANLSFAELQRMRDASKTGGALGSITERELELLGSTVQSLDIGQSPEQLRKNLETIQRQYEDAQAKLMGITLID